MTARQSHSWYAYGADNPRHDPSFVARVQHTLERRRGRVVHLEEEIGGDPWIIWESVQALRDLGFVIDGRRGCAGYVYLEWQRPRKWLRLVCLINRYPLPFFMSAPKKMRDGEIPGQLRLMKGGAGG